MRRRVNERAPVEAVNLEQRAEPQQKRSAERIAAIVAATQRLFDKHTAEAITTSAVAAEAGVPVSSVYRYFPNIYAIYRTIFEKFKAETDEIFVAQLADPSINWRVRMPMMITALRKLLQDNPSYGVVFRLTLTTHELSSLREEWNMRLAEHLAERWRNGDDGFKGRDADLVARMAVEIYCAAEMLIVQNADAPEMQDTLFSETIIVLERYLSHYLD